MTPSLADENWGHIVAGSRDGSVEVRSGLILGLRDVYIDGIDDVIFSWVAEEQDREVRDRLYEHMIRQSGKCPGYTEYVVSVYEAEPPGSAVRLRMEANASGTKIFGRFRQIAYNGSGDLFGATSVTNNYHFNGPITGGAVAVGEGNAENEGEVRVQNYAPQTIQTIQSRLEMIEDAVRASALDQSDKEAALARIAGAKADPSSGKVRTAVDFVDGLGKIVGAGTALAPVVSPHIGAILSAIGLG